MAHTEADLVRIAGDLVQASVQITRDEGLATDFSFWMPRDGELEVLSLDVGFGPVSGEPEVRNTGWDFEQWLGGIAFHGDVEINDGDVEIVKNEIIRFLKVGKANG